MDYVLHNIRGQRKRCIEHVVQSIVVNETMRIKHDLVNNLSLYTIPSQGLLHNAIEA